MLAGSFIRASFVGIALLLAAPRASLAWVTRLHGSVGIDDPPRTIVRDPAGDVLAASAEGVAKYDGTSGDTVWSVPGEPTQGTGDPIAVDGHGDLIVLQRCCGGGSSSLQLVKRSGVDGRVLWHTAPPAGFSGTPMFAADGDVLVVGTVSSDLDGLKSDLVVLKLDGADGAQAWLSILSADAAQFVDASVVDSRGDVAVGGMLLRNSGARALVTKVSGRDGRLVWRTVVESAARAIDAIAVGPTGDVFVAGSDAAVHFLVARLRSSTGELLWRDVSVPGTGPALATDSAGGVVVAGVAVVDLNGRGQPRVARWRADGTVAWQRTLDAPGDATGVTVAVVDREVVLGGLVNRTLTGSDLAVFDVALSDGSPRWQLIIDDDGDRHGDGVAFGLVPDGSSGVFVSGQLAYAGSGRDALIARLSVADGSASWQHVINEQTSDVDETATTVSPDPDGNLVVGGELGSAETGLRVGVVKLSAADGAELWRTTIPGLFGPGRTAVDRDGNVLAAGVSVVGASQPPGSGGPFDPGTPAPVVLTVAKTAGADGRELWRTAVGTGDASVRAGETAVATDGSVFATGYLWYPNGQSVVKLDGATGEMRWLSPIVPLASQGIFSSADSWPVRLGPDDDLFVAGTAISATRQEELAVSRLDARSGEVLWSVTVPDARTLTGLAPDRSGDVVLVASTLDFPARRVVVKLAGANGTLLWRTEMSKGANRGVALTDGGDVLAAGSAIDGGLAKEAVVVLAVAKLDGTTGTQLWEYRSDRAMPGEALSVATDHAGDAWVAGSLGDASGEQSFAVLKLDGVGGGLRWTRLVPGAGPDPDGEASNVLLDGTGRVVAVGALTGDGTGLDFGVVSLDAVTGADDASCRFPRSCGGPVPHVVMPRSPGGRLPRR